MARISLAGVILTYDVAVVGAGPAGLAAALASRRLGASVVILEQGKPLLQRSQDDQTDIVSGVGGAGLCSDGKFSFFPSATALWSVEPHRLLRAGYEWLKDILTSSGMAVPDFPSNFFRVEAPQADRLIRKEYPSFYLPVKDRNAIVWQLATELAVCLRPDQYVKIIEQRPDNSVWLRGRDGLVLAKARRVVLALGRLGPLMLHQSLASQDFVFRRVELGIRIEQAAKNFVLSRDGCLDPKLVIHSADGCSCRTFCCCRDGLIVATSSSGLISVSGRADCPPTGRSNIGFLVRLTDVLAGAAALRDALRLQPLDRPIVEGLSDLIDPSGRVRASSRIARLLGPTTARHLAQGLNGLRASVDLPMADVELHAPAIEGIGWYPRIGLDLKIPDRPMFVAGDTTGIFRGLTAALVSGYVAGSAATLAVIGEASRRVQE
jgi:hypothetical protein